MFLGGGGVGPRILAAGWRAVRGAKCKGLCFLGLRFCAVFLFVFAEVVRFGVGGFAEKC